MERAYTERSQFGGRGPGPGPGRGRGRGSGRGRGPGVSGHAEAKPNFGPRQTKPIWVCAKRTQFRAAPNEPNCGCAKEGHTMGCCRVPRIGFGRGRREKTQEGRRTTKPVVPRSAPLSFGDSLAVWVGRGENFVAAAGGLSRIITSQSRDLLVVPGYLETAGAGCPAPTVLWNRFQCMQRFLARKKGFKAHVASASLIPISG